MTLRVAILISGGGSNMLSLVKSMTGDHPGRPCLVLSNRPDAQGLVRAAALGIDTAVVDHRAFAGDRLAFEAVLTERLEQAQPDILCFAGFMRVLTDSFVARWSGKMLNIHPSLLPKYKGLDTHARALAAGDKVAGCSVHEVTAELDGGPVLGQMRVPIVAGESASTLAERVLKAEHKLYPAVLRRFCAGDRSRLDLSFGAETS